MTDNMEPTGFNPDADTLAPSELRVVLVCDVVESVRWMEQDEDNAVTRWQAFTQHVRNTIVPAHGGSVVKSTGDGMMIEFPTARGAVQAAAAMHAQAAADNSGYSEQRHMLLRAGVHQTYAKRDSHDLYGHGVNLAARITTLAGAGETIVSAPVRDRLTDSLDGEIEDMGDCYLKHVTQPQRVYRVGAGGVNSLLYGAATDGLDTGPSIAVLPFSVRAADQANTFVGELIADSLIAGFSQSNYLHVISRLSSSAVAVRGLALHEIAERLKVGYLVSGSVTIQGEKAFMFLELAESSGGRVLCTETYSNTLADLCDPGCDTYTNSVNTVTQAVLAKEYVLVQSQGLPTVQSYSVLFAAIGHMHKVGIQDFDRSKTMLEYLTDRHKFHAKPYAWLANWHALRVTQNHSATPSIDVQRALHFADKALSCDGDSALAHVINGALQINLRYDFAAARVSLDAALRSNPNDPLAWSYFGILNGFEGMADAACSACEKALALTPVDPIKHFYEALAASAMLSAHRFDKAISLAKKSLKANRTHPSTYRILAIAQELAGQHDDASRTIVGLMHLMPSYSLAEFKNSSPFVRGTNADLFSKAIASAGLI
jgi:adenylate cyclase